MGELLDALADAAVRGVSIELAGSSPTIVERIRDREATTFDTLWDWAGFQPAASPCSTSKRRW